MTERKTGITVELKGKDAPEGSFKAVFSRFGVIDHDGDVTLPDAFTKGQRVPVAGTGHNWDVPTMGYGVINFDSEKAWIDGLFNLKMQSGRELYESIKFAHENEVPQEYSYAYDVKSKGDLAALKQYPGAKRILAKLDPKEVSPVLLGAGIGTGTWDVKARGDVAFPADDSNENCPVCGDAVNSHGAGILAVHKEIYSSILKGTLPDGFKDSGSFTTWDGCMAHMQSTAGGGHSEESATKICGFIAHRGKGVFNGEMSEQKYADQATQVLARLEAFASRSKSLADLRAKIGRSLSAANRERILQTVNAARATASELEALLAESDADGSTGKGRGMPAGIIEARLAIARLTANSTRS